jgi:outer membrane protein OmpA-like peptidoglycan-associated protein
MVKLDKDSLPAGAGVMGENATIVSVTPGLLVKINFRVTRRREVASIGRPADRGLIMTTEDTKEPIQIQGSVEMLQVLLDGVNAHLPGSDVILGVRGAAETVTITGDRLDGPIQFRTRAYPLDDVKEWRLTVLNSRGEVIKTFEGQNTVPDQMEWAGITDQGGLIGGGELYRYRMEVWYRAGGYSASAVHTFGVNQKSFVSLDIQGSGFGLGSASLRPRTKKLLADVARTLREYPNEVVVIEGHTDSQGSEEVNLSLSRQRAEAALEYLVKDQKLDPERFVVNWYGESKPAASNEVQEGREFNRRVEIKGQLLEVTMSQLLNQYRTEPGAFIEGSPVEVDADGRFQASIENVSEDGVRINLISATGAATEGRVHVPDLEILQPEAELRLGYGEKSVLYRVGYPGPDGVWEPGERALVYKLEGKTDPANTVQLGEDPLEVDEQGFFNSELDLEMGKVNMFSLLVKNQAGHIRIARLQIRVTDMEEDGQLVVVTDPIPKLSVQLPPEGVLLHNPHLRVPGFTDPGNKVRVNGQNIPVDKDGGFAANLELTGGENLLRFEVIDPQGHAGAIERTLNLKKDNLFFLAFADGKIGQLQGKGYLEGAGMRKEKEFYQEGRAAYYLKGTVAGKPRHLRVRQWNGRVRRSVHGPG